MGLAASVVLLLAAIGIYWQADHSWPPGGRTAQTQIAASVELEERVNPSTRPLLVNLPDKSTVLLAPGARIKFSANLLSGHNREIYLEGDAFFEVTKKPLQPFLVFTDKVVTKVLGTSFRISTDGEDRLTVVVKTGMVSLFSGKTDRQKNNYQVPDLVLSANQQAVYGPENQPPVLQQLKPEELKKLEVPETDFDFKNTVQWV